MPLSHDFNRAASTKLLKLILALHRRQLVDIPDAGHTDGILLLLRIANGDSELMTWATSVTGANAEEMRASCVAFIERVCFSGDTDPFGVLGLNPWANAEAVKEHYRLLIRIFHPDRGQVSNATAEAYSARINQAYASLKQQVGDDSGNLSKRSTASYHGQSGIIPRRYARPVSAENNGGDALRWASRLTPARVLLGMALLAGLVIYLSFPQKIRMQSRASDVVAKPMPTLPAISYTPATQLPVNEVKPFADAVVNDSPVEVVASAEKKQTAIPVQSPVVEKPVLLEAAPPVKKPLAKVAPATAVTEKKAKAADINSDTKPADTKPVNKTEAVQPAVAAITAPANTLPSPVEPNVNKKLNVPATDAARLTEAGEKPVQLKLVEMPSDRELHDLIANFMSNYANGDVNAFMQIFDEQVRTDEDGGKLGLYSTYANFFAKTDSRSIVLKDLQWKKQGPLLVALADYRASTLRTGDAQVKTSSGTLQIEVAKTGGRVVISGFFHQVAKK